MVAAVAAVAALFGLSTSCAQDQILPVPQFCGDGAVVGTEACDSESLGCVQCQIEVGWRCPDNECVEICGDEITVGEEDCDPPDSALCDSSCRTAERPEPCDMNGYWMVRQTDFSVDFLVSQLQTSTSWFLYKFTQEGEVFSTDAALHCGIVATGSAVVRPRLGGEKAILYASELEGNDKRGPRSGTFKQDGALCEFSFERWYIVRGLEASFLPDDFTAHIELDDLPRLIPTTEDSLDLSQASPAGVIDMDNDGRPGFSWQVTSVATGVRHTVQREWNEYLTDSEAWPIPTHAVEFTTRSLFKNQETILYVEDCGKACKLLQTGAAPSPAEPSRVTFRYIGTELSDPRVAKVIGGRLREDPTVDAATCEKVLEALPHQSEPEQ